MSEEEIGQEFDRALRAAVQGISHVAEGINRRMAERDRTAREEAAASLRQQSEQTRSIHEKVGRESFWENATGERVANAATYGAALSGLDPRAGDIYETVRDQAAKRYGVDVDELRAQHPGSEEARRNALLNAVDDYLAANRADAAAEEDREKAGTLDERAEEEQQAGEPQADVDHDAAAGASADAEEHDAERDERRADGAAEDHSASVHELDRNHDRADASPAKTARLEAATSYPESANAGLGQSRTRKQPKSRGDKSQGQGAAREAELTR